jgi:hypothetical protein
MRARAWAVRGAVIFGAFSASSTSASCGKSDEAPPEARSSYIRPTCASPGQLVTVHLHRFNGCAPGELSFNLFPFTGTWSRNPVAGVDIFATVPDDAPGRWTVIARCNDPRVGTNDVTVHEDVKEMFDLTVPCPPDSGSASDARFDDGVPPPRKPAGSIEVRVDLNTDKPYATAFLQNSRDRVEADEIRAREQAADDNLLQPDLAAGACMDRKAYPRPPTTRAVVPLEVGPAISLEDAFKPVFNLLPQADTPGLYASVATTLELPTADLLDLGLETGPKITELVPGLDNLHVTYPLELLSDFEPAYFDPAVDYEIDLSVRRDGFTMVLLSSGAGAGVDVVCKVDHTIHPLRIPKAQLVRLGEGGYLQIQQIRLVKGEFTFGGFVREISMRSVTSHSVPFRKKPPPP